MFLGFNRRRASTRNWNLSLGSLSFYDLIFGELHIACRFPLEGLWKGRRRHAPFDQNTNRLLAFIDKKMRRSAMQFAVIWQSHRVPPLMFISCRSINKLAINYLDSAIELFTIKSLDIRHERVDGNLNAVEFNQQQTRGVRNFISSFRALFPDNALTI